MWRLQKRSDYLDFIGRARAPQAAGTPGGYGHSCPCAKSSGRQHVLVFRCASFLLLVVNARWSAFPQERRLLVRLGREAAGSGRIAGHSHGPTGMRRLAKSPSSLKSSRSSFQHSALPTHPPPAVSVLAGPTSGFRGTEPLHSVPTHSMHICFAVLRGLVDSLPTFPAQMRPAPAGDWYESQSFPSCSTRLMLRWRVRELRRRFCRTYGFGKELQYATLHQVQGRPNDRHTD